MTASSSWTKEQDRQLCRSWLANSGGRNINWSKIQKEYDSHFSKRTANEFKTRWNIIDKAIMLFSGFVAQCTRRTGATDPIGDAKMLYTVVQKEDFKFEHCFDILKTQPKWMPIKDFEIKQSTGIRTKRALQAPRKIAPKLAPGQTLREVVDLTQDRGPAEIVDLTGDDDQPVENNKRKKSPEVEKTDISAYMQSAQFSTDLTIMSLNTSKITNTIYKQYILDRQKEVYERSLKRQKTTKASIDLDE